ncbi:MAG: PmeII family type II restriction endonuclease [Candidatus Hinthialibacter antarcticus]|nr:PmeII family type II restriction endonuclease [Candidatus Hinthialibacter antarcticus]
MDDLHKKIREFISGNIGDFHQRRLLSLEKLKLNDVLKRKNPYLFKAKNILQASDLVRTILDARLSSQEETIFGEFLEQLAIFVSETSGGRKSSSQGIDLEMDRDGKRYVVSIKSGPNWGNSGQIRNMIDDFEHAKKIYHTNNPQQEIVAINGCCYGRSHPGYRKGGYFKFCGQAFWEFISGDENLYTKIIEPLGDKAKRRNDQFAKAYAKVINQFTLEFSQEFCTDGVIDWGKLVEFNSSK